MRYLRANDLTTQRTVDDAFRALVTEWDAFTLEDGNGTKEGPNKRLVATKEAIPDALWEHFRAHYPSASRYRPVDVRSGGRGPNVGSTMERIR